MFVSYLQDEVFSSIYVDYIISAKSNQRPTVGTLRFRSARKRDTIVKRGAGGAYYAGIRVIPDAFDCSSTQPMLFYAKYAVNAFKESVDMQS